MRYLIILLFFSTAGWSKSVQAPLSALSEDVLVTAQSSDAAEKLAKELNQRFKVIDQFQDYIIVQVKLNDMQTLTHLKSTPGVLSIERSMRVVYKDVASCTNQNQPTPTSDLKSEMLCLSLQACKPSGRTRLWAQNNIASDLAQKFLLENKIPRVTKIAVVDSGFDRSLLNQINNDRFQVKAGLKSIKNLDEDSDGHGSRVSSLIKGSQGIGASIDSPLTVYSLGDEISGMSNARLGTSLLRACTDGNQVINVSIGASGHGLFQFSLEAILSKSIYKKLRAQGCILVHAAGNDGGTYSSSEFNALEPQVKSANASGDKSFFSNGGDIEAPGEGVAGLKAHTVGGDIADSCNDGPQDFASGTSFSAPLYAAQLALIRDVLMTSSEFKTKSRLKQAELLHQISKETSVDGIINSYLSVRLASEWVKNPKVGVELAQKNLAQATDLECKKPVIDCNHKLNSCIQQEKCESTARERGLLCHDRAPAQEIALIRDLEQKGDLEGASFWRRVYQLQFPNAKIDLNYPIETMKEEIKSDVSQARIGRWVEYYANWLSMAAKDSTAVRNFLKPLATQAFLNRVELLGREKNPTAGSNLRSLFVGIKKSNLDSNIKAKDLVNLINNNTTSRPYLDALYLGFKKGVVTSAEVTEILDALIKSDSSLIAVENAVLIIRFLKFSSADIAIYTRKILQNNLLNDNILENLFMAGVTDHLDQQWFSLALEISNKPQIGEKTKYAIAALLFINKKEGFPTEFKQVIRQIVTHLSKGLDENDENHQWTIAMIQQINSGL